MLGVLEFIGVAILVVVGIVGINVLRHDSENYD